MIDRLATKLLLKQLVTSGNLELEGDPEDALAALTDAVMPLLTEHAGDVDCAARLGLFLERHPSVAETFASEELLAARLAVWQSAQRRFAKPVEHRNLALEQQILDDLDDDNARLIYGDVLQQHGDPLGELVARQASKNARAASALLSQYRTFLFGPAEEYLRLFKPEYHLGFIRSIAITRKQRIELEWPVVTGWLLDRPISRFVECIAIGPLPGRDVENGIWNAVFASPRVALRSVTVTSKDVGLAGALELGRIAGTSPRLQEVRIQTVRVATEPFEHSSLRRLDVSLTEGNGLAACLVESALPALEELSITTRWSTTARTLWPSSAPALRTLRIAVDDPGRVIEALVDDPLLPRLAELDLAHVDATAVDVLAANASRFARLTKLALPDHELTSTTLRTLARTIPALKP